MTDFTPEAVEAVVVLLKTELDTVHLRDESWEELAHDAIAAFVEAEELIAEEEFDHRQLLMSNPPQQRRTGRWRIVGPWRKRD